MKASTKDQISGTFHELKGKVKATTGKTVGNPRLQAEGQNEEAGGKIQKKVGQVEKVIGK